METPFILASAAQSADTSSVMNFNELVVALTWLAFLIAFVVLGKLLEVGLGVAPTAIGEDLIDFD